MTDLDKELWTAVSREDKNLFEELIERGADVHARNQNGATLLHYALTLHKDADMIDFLINKGLDATAQDHHSNTSLDYLFANFKYYPNPYKTMWKLIEAGCDMNLLNTRGRTSFELALLYNNYHNIHTDEGKEKRDLEKVVFIDKLIDHGADVTGLDDDGYVITRQKLFLRKFDRDTYLNLLSRGAIFPSEQTINYRAEFIDEELVTCTLSDEKKYTGIKALRKAIDNSKTLDPKVKEKALKEIDKTLAELKNPAFNALVTKIRAGFDNEKVETRYRQIAKDMSSDYPEVTLLKDCGEGRIKSGVEFDSEFLGSAINAQKESYHPILENTEIVTKISPYLNALELKALRTALKSKTTIKKYNPKEIKKIFDTLSASIDESANPNKFADKISQQNKNHFKGGKGY
ncbi:hypothetical protein phytr_4090 [Candidatus Phycorickettsia trachydisci]|uniref:Uncharacterized protein n=1 Tax=Candidatus Phycorickettsia trachydisci TaxID=2115978 RepID=A0A2P1P7V5_9RICK|nr:ankyrin repeat domain-containing protein [Candidatus Phycorickettsia trachydisci]AVP87360.1 hypothetical protein phytr_4090 [Candidatus Phycorickettsia trachydisci]